MGNCGRTYLDQFPQQGSTAESCIVPRPVTWLLPTFLPHLPASPLAHCTPSQAFFLFLEQPQLPPATGPLHLLYLVLRTLFPQILPGLTSAPSSSSKSTPESLHCSVPKTGNPNPPVTVPNHPILSEIVLLVYLLLSPPAPEQEAGLVLLTDVSPAPGTYYICTKDLK